MLRAKALAMTCHVKFLIIKLSSLGDIIHALPIVSRLRQNFPDAQIDWLVGKKGVELLELVNEIDNVYLLNWNNICLIQKHKYDYVIDVQGLLKTGFLSRLSSGKKVIGFKNTREFADLFYDEKINVGNLFNTNKHIVDMNLELVSSVADVKDERIKFLIPAVSPSSELVTTFLHNRKKIIIFPSTTWESKLWNMDYWFELIKRLSPDSQIYLCASKSDLVFVESLIKKLEVSKIDYVNLVGKTNIKDLIYLIQNVDLVIGLDSAGLHLASAVKNDFGSPEVIGIYGPTSPYRTGPYSLIKNTLYLSEMDCIACRKKQCPLGHHKCMEDILPDSVIKIIFDVLGKALNV